MKGLAPDLFQRRFQDLLEIGRARLPALAPRWTDHNAHDPGITLVELLAWVAEAQLYSLARLRRDERAAYAALLGLAPGGSRGARGLIWGDRLDPSSPAATFSRSVVIPSDAVVSLLDAESPTFRPTERLLWVPGQIEKLETRRAGGPAIDHTASNERGGPAFLPFGTRADRRDVLAMTFTSRDESGLFGPIRQSAKGARWAIGVRAAPPLGGAAAESEESSPARRSPLTAALVTDDQRIPLPIVADSTDGLLATGALLLDLDGVTGSPGTFIIELRAPNGLGRPPRVIRLEPNVLPIVQGRWITRERHDDLQGPDASFELDVPGLRFTAGTEPIELEVEAAGTHLWQRRERLSDCGPDERVYELDTQAGRITFGNGVNGRIFPAGAQVLVSYAVSEGAGGRIARNRRWKVAGFPGAFGVNPDPVGGGAAPLGWNDQRREARRRSREEHALVSSDDLAAAARALPLLEVARAWVVPIDDKTPRTGALTLVAMRSRPAASEADIQETARWLEAIRRRLVARIPLGARLIVVAPRYVEFSIHANLEADAARDPTVVKQEVGKQLRRRLALTSSAGGMAPRQPGVPVTLRDLGAWIRAVDGVRRVRDLRLLRANGRSVNEITVPRSGLPKFDFGRSTIDVSRPGAGGTL